MNWLLILLLSHLPSTPETAPLKLGFVSEPEPIRAEYVLANYFVQSKKNVVRGLSMDASFDASVPKINRAAGLQARRKITSTGQVKYDIIESRGDSTVKKEFIARYLNAEMEPPNSLAKNVAITQDNYKFKPKGIREYNGRQVQVFEINPRKKRVGLFKGEIWVDSESGLTLREEGRFVKSPSVFLKKIEFTREFGIHDGLSILEKMDTRLDARIWGPAHLIVTYSNFNWDEFSAPVTTVGEPRN